MVKKAQIVARNWDDVNIYLFQLLELKSKEARIEKEVNEKMDKVLAPYNKQLDEIEDEQKALKNSIEKFVLEHKDELDKNQKALSWGHISYKSETVVTVRSIKAAINALKKLKLTKYIKKVEEIDREAVAKIDQSKLVGAGIKVSTKETVIIKPCEDTE